MKFLLNFGLALSLQLFGTTGVNGACCPDGWISHRESCYLFGKMAMDFITAEQYCRQHGGHLVHVNDASENNFLKDQIHERSTDIWYIGLSDDNVEGEWLWYGTNTVPEFTDFISGDGGDHQAEDCVIFYKPGHADHSWVDTSCMDRHYFICEGDDAVNLIG